MSPSTEQPASSQRRSSVSPRTARRHLPSEQHSFSAALAALQYAHRRHASQRRESQAALREQAARAGREALMVLAADTISTVRELRLETAKTGDQTRSPNDVENLRLTQYRHCLRLLDERLPDSPLVARLDTELRMVACNDGRSARAGRVIELSP